MKKLTLPTFSIVAITFICSSANAQDFYTKAEIDCSDINGIYYCRTNSGAPVTGTVKDFNGGVLESEQHYMSGRLNGTQKYYYPHTGRLAREENYTNGKPSGIFKEYYESGKLKIKAYWYGNRKNGKVYTYDEDGKLLHKIKYTNGHQTSLEDYY